jgi:predicted metal-dependent phosphoesterase TrpH
MIVDFHCHSTASDGTLAPEELAEAASSFTAFSLTDHDNCDGVAACTRAAAEKGVKFVSGIELSIEPGEGFDKFHLLGFGFDPDNGELKSFLKKVLDGRNERNRRILENFAAIGIEIEFDDINSYANGDVLAMPHFARWLMNHGFSTGVVEAFNKYLLPDSPKETRCYEERFHPSQEDAFGVIHRAGGVAVMAHPKYWRREWREKGVDLAAAEKELSRLKEAGLDGVEALYQANSPGENVDFVRLATKLGYLKTAGSDFHGSNKPTIELGMEVSENYIAPFLERLNLV